MNVQEHLLNLSKKRDLPSDHVAYLQQLKRAGVEPKVIYDIGANLLFWTNEAKRLWPNAQYILFDALKSVEFLFTDYYYHIGVLSDVDGKQVKFYQDDINTGGSSYYREVGNYFPPDRFVTLTTNTLDTVVEQYGFPPPDLVKIDVQGSEIDILKGAVKTLRNAKDLIVELQHECYNEGAPLAAESVPFIESMGWKCVTPLFCNNGPDGDYHFINTRI